MSENEKQEEQPGIFERLAGETPGERLAAIAELETAQAVSPEALSRLETLAAADKSKPVREAALAALEFPAVRQARMVRTIPLGISTRQAIVREIDQWQKQQLVDENQANLLKGRYTVQYTSPAQKQVDPNAPKPTLAQTLLSETSIKTFLYLGAFFVVAASLILAALVEGLRLPILVMLTLAFGGAALLLKKRLPQPSSVLFMVASALIPITAGVIAETLALQDSALSVFWLITFGGMAIFWAFATWFYDSKLFSIATFAAIFISTYHLAEIFQTQFDLFLFLWGVANLAGLGWMYGLRRWKQEDGFTNPLFIVLQLSQASLLLISATYSLYHHFNLDTSSGRPAAWWIATSLTWLTGGLFYFASHWLNHRKGIFPALAALSVAPAAWLASLALQPGPTAQLVILLVTGVFYTAASEIAPRLKFIQNTSLQYGFLLGSMGLFASASLVGMWQIFDDNGVTLFFSALLVTSICYALAHVVHPRWVIWSGALFSGLLAYLMFYELPFMETMKPDGTWVWLLPSLALLAPDALFRSPLTRGDRDWRLPMLAMGAFSAAILVILLFAPTENPAAQVLAGAILALFFLFYAWRREVNLAYLSTAIFAITLANLLESFGLGFISLAVTALALAYFVPGFLISILRPGAWTKVLLNSGLALGTLVSFYTPLEESTGIWAFLPAAITALMWTAEAFRRRNVLLGFPSNGFYVLAYFILLARLDVSEPQFFSVGAAALGFLQHYLLVRANRNDALAFLTGLVSQLTLLGTTYIQMVANVELGFFAALFFQSLVVMIYGLVIRSRSLFGVPIAFVVLGVFTIVLNILQGIFTFLLIGCTGILMILAGIVAVLLRERISKIGSRISDWSA